MDKPVLPAAHRAEILEAIRGPFGLGSGSAAAPLGSGHINETVLVNDGDRHLVAQRINTAVFPNPEDLVHNARLIETHLAAKGDVLKVVRHLPGEDGRFLYGPHGNVRVLEYFPGSQSIEVLESPAQARLAATSFARFSRLLSDFDHSKLVTVIPDFHSPALRWRQFEAALADDAAHRSSDCADEIAFVLDSGPQVDEWQKLMASLPIRVCHNDCKINNLLVHRETGDALAIIDLDTCMPGPLLTEFGDLVRTCTSPEPEDSIRLDRVRARPDVFEALVQGFVRGWAGGITAEERASLLPGGLMLCFIIGLRFLTDFLAGDRYFSIAHARHNLDRARNQFRLFSSLKAQEPDLERMF